MNATKPADASTHEAKAETLRRELAAMHEKRHGLDEAIRRRQEALSRLEARAILALAPISPRHE
jgi:hypothetical protein